MRAPDCRNRDHGHETDDRRDHHHLHHCKSGSSTKPPITCPPSLHLGVSQTPGCLTQLKGASLRNGSAESIPIC
jgi:hypothetical protein